MKTKLMTKMIVLSFALIAVIVLGLSNASAVTQPPPCLNLLECGCEVYSPCPNPASEISCTYLAENCGDFDFVLSDLATVGGAQQAGEVNVPAGTQVQVTNAFQVTMPGDYNYELILTATDEVGNATTDGCAGTVTVSPCLIEVPIDIKPMSCPNPLNVKDKGVLSVAILGTSIFDVIGIDPDSILLVGMISPLRCSYEDVATPNYSMAMDTVMPCTEEGPDGYLDLVCKFDNQAVVQALSLDGECDGLVMPLLLAGTSVDGIPIEGMDLVWIINKDNVCDW